MPSRSSGSACWGVITANVAAFFVTKEDSAEHGRLDALEDRLERIERLLEVIAAEGASDRAS